MNYRSGTAVAQNGIELPGTDGYQLIKELRLRAGIQLHLAKPVQPSELVTVVSSLVARRSG